MAMLQRLVLVVLAIALLAPLMASDAEARRRGKFFVIPGGGASDTLVKVRDFPDRAPFIAETGEFIDLGYRFKSYGGGEWIGYLGSSSKYLALKPGGAEILALAAGLDRLPPVPDRPAGSSFWIWMFVIGLLSIGFKVLKGILGVTGMAARGAVRVTAGAVAAQSGSTNNSADWMNKADAAMNRPTTASTPRRPAMAAPRAAAGGGGFGQRATFGRR